MVGRGDLEPLFDLLLGGLVIVTLEYCLVIDALEVVVPGNFQSLLTVQVESDKALAIGEDVDRIKVLGPDLLKALEIRALAIETIAKLQMGVAFSP